MGAQVFAVLEHVTRRPAFAACHLHRHPPKEGGQRGLPGVPSYVPRSHAEAMWKQTCDMENAHLQRYKENPPSFNAPVEIMPGYMVVQHPSYIEVRYPRPDMSDADALSGGGGRASRSDGFAGSTGNSFRPACDSRRASGSQAGSMRLANGSPANYLDAGRA